MRELDEKALYIDTEFNGFGGELMSMALVSSDGQEWYRTLPLPPKIEPWVAENVVPFLDREPVNREVFQLSFKTFLERFDNPVIYADWYTDLALFFQAMAGKDHTTSFSFPCRAVLLKDVPDLKAEVQHNALSDARALRDWHVAYLDATLPKEDGAVLVTLIPRSDGGIRVCSSDLPGLILSGPDPRAVGANIWPAIEALRAYLRRLSKPLSEEGKEV